MSKKIKIEIKDIEKLEFSLASDASKGDYISLSEMEQISFDSVKEELKGKKKEILAQVWEQNKDAVLASSPEYKALEKKVNDFELVKSKLETEFEKKLNSALNAKEKEATEEWQEEKKLHVERYHELRAELQAQTESFESKLEAELSKANSSKDLMIEKLNSTIDKLNDKIESLTEKSNEQKEVAAEKIEVIKLQANDKLTQAQEKIEQLKEKFESDKAVLEAKVENKLSREFNDKLNDLSKELGQKETELRNIEKQMKLEIDNSILLKQKELEEEYSQIIKEKDEEIQKMEMRRNLLNIKEIGEDLERWMTSEASNYLSLPNVVHKKANAVIDGTKPDFIFEILNDDKSILTSVTIEAKSEALKGTSSKKRNEDHIAKLDSDRKKNQSEYALLVTELEKEDDFIFKKVGEFENMYMVRPRYYIPFLQLIYNLSMKKNEINDLQIDFKEKQEILREFEEFKVMLIETTMDKIATNFEDINKEAEKVIGAAEKIISKTRTAEKHLGTLENKFNKFKINKLVERM